MRRRLRHRRGRRNRFHIDGTPEMSDSRAARFVRDLGFWYRRRWHADSSRQARGHQPCDFGPSHVEHDKIWRRRHGFTVSVTQRTVAFRHISRYAAFLSAPVSESIRTRLVCARWASLLNDCPIPHTLALSTMINRSCSVFVGAKRTSSGARAFPNCCTHLSAAGLSVFLWSAASARIRTATLSGASSAYSVTIFSSA